MSEYETLRGELTRRMVELMTAGQYAVLSIQDQLGAIEAAKLIIYSRILALSPQGDKEAA